MDDVEDGRGDQEDEFLSEQQEVLKLLFKTFSAYPFFTHIKLKTIGS